jgi:hypothetical protein
MTEPFADKLAQLSEEFVADQLQTLSKGGKSFDYPQWSECVARLNRVLGIGGWSLEVLEKWRDEVYPEWLCCHVMVTIHQQQGVPNETVMESIDAMEIAMTERTVSGKKVKIPVDLGDSWKGAVSNAAKKACWHWGLGLYLSRKQKAVEYEAAQADNDAQAKEQGWPDYTTRTARHSELLAHIRQLQERKLLKEDDGSALKSLDYGWPMTHENYNDYTARLEQIVEANAQALSDQPQSVELGSGGN